MGLYLRKAFNIGKLFRVNLSKSGLGISSGIKGARIGVNSKGKKYIHAGRHGLYYRKNLGNKSLTTKDHFEKSNIVHEESNDGILMSLWLIVWEIIKIVIIIAWGIFSFFCTLIIGFILGCIIGLFSLLKH